MLESRCRGAAELFDELKEMYPHDKLKVTSNVCEMGKCEQMAIYLREDTWDNHMFAEQVLKQT